jgi:DNA-binding transcriptional regulator YdaS (Cro superfamily)
MRPIDIAVTEVGSQQALADQCGVSQALVSQWVSDATAIHIAHFQKIIDASVGKVTTEMLLADQLGRPARRRRLNRKSA